MSKQKIPQFLKYAIWRANDKKSGYEGILILFDEMEIDHIIPERVVNKPREPFKFEKWKAKYDPLCPSTRNFCFPAICNYGRG